MLRRTINDHTNEILLMSIIYLITAILILLYLVYPLWLMMMPGDHVDDTLMSEKVDRVSLVLLSFNGKEFITEKINFLLQELTHFQHYELIIIDDKSTDGSKEIIEKYRESDHINVILKNERKGIPDSMNTAVGHARYEHIIFCDQRQQLSINSIQRIVEPLMYHRIGAVSGCISYLDKDSCSSMIRKYENFVKSKESKNGSLIGVYGPFYAIKKSCYEVIPEHIILDDLYLSIRIIKSKQIKILEECQFTEDGLSIFYNYSRTKRYLNGFRQILNETGLLSGLGTKQLMMLIWHKYFRLLIPVFLFVSYVYTGIMGISNLIYLTAFLILTFVCLVCVLPVLNRINFRMKNSIRINILYFLALTDIFFNDICFKWIINFNRK